MLKDMCNVCNNNKINYVFLRTHYTFVNVKIEMYKEKDKNNDDDNTVQEHLCGNDSQKKKTSN